MNSSYMDLLLRVHVFCREGIWLCFHKDSNRVIELTEEESLALIHISQHPEDESNPFYANTIENLYALLGDARAPIKGLEQINSFYLRLNRRCNLHCSYCRAISAQEVVENNQVLTPQLASRAASVMWGLGAKGVGLHGGEPFVDLDNTFSVISAIRETVPEMEIGLTCNGTLITERIASFLKKNGVKVSVELDGSEETHNLFKRYPNGRSAFNDALLGAKLLHEYGVLAAIESTVSGIEGYDNDGYQWLSELFHSIPVVVSRIKSRIPMDVVCHGQYLDRFLLQQLESIWHSESVFNEAKAGIVNVSAAPCTSAYRCVCFLDKVSVDLDGSVYLCPKEESERTVIGNINDTNFSLKFNEKRLSAANRFSSKAVSQVWYSNLIEFCVDSTFDDGRGIDRLYDENELERFFEDIIYFYSRNDVSNICDEWVDSGF